MQDYSKLGLRCGIEIHQQLDTHKLFCNCESRIRDSDPDGSVVRKIRAVAGEMGDIDPAALHELLKDREFIYEFYQDSNCLVELDEEPPHQINEGALDTVLEISLLLNARPVDEIQVMRKTVIDGSNTSGFQRTMLVATDGFVQVGDKKIKIPSVCLEEDACRIIKKEGKRTWYRLDRLGIPLVEIGTDPDITEPKEAKDVAEKIGMLLRATGRVKRGLGTIRQDVNVSIRGGQRIEIKGVQALNDIPGLIDNEILRQQGLLEIKKVLHGRGFKKIPDEIIDLSKIFEKSESKIVKGKQVFGICVPSFAGLLGKELMPGYRFGTELSEIAKQLSSAKGIFHSDELPAYGVSEQEVKSVSNALKISQDDAFILISSPQKEAEDALAGIIKRCNEAAVGVPKEVRKADKTITRFMRPLPGSARMYPETDEPTISIDAARIDGIELSKTPEERRDELISMGLGPELANQLIHSKVLDTFLDVSKRIELKSSLIASILLSAPDGIDTCEVLTLLNKNRIAKESVDELMAAMAEGKSAEDVAREKNLFLADESESRKMVEEIIKKNPDADFGRLMGYCMSKLRGKADALTVKRLIEEVKR